MTHSVMHVFLTADDEGYTTLFGQFFFGKKGVIMTIWISNRPGEGSAASRSGVGSVAAAGVAGGITQAFGGASPYSDPRGPGGEDPRADPEWERCDRQENERRKRIVDKEQRARRKNAYNFSHAIYKVDTSRIPFTAFSQEAVSECPASKVTRQAEIHMRLLRPKFPNAPHLRPDDFSWRTDGGDYLWLSAHAGIRVDIRNGKAYKFYSPTAESAPEHERAALRDLYRRISEIYIMDREVAAYSAVAEIAKRGCAAGLNQYSINTDTTAGREKNRLHLNVSPPIYETSIHNMMLGLRSHMITPDQITLSEGAGLYGLIDYLSDRLEQKQISRLEEILSYFTAEMEAIEAKHGVRTRYVYVAPTVILTSGNCSSLNANGNIANIIDDKYEDGFVAHLATLPIEPAPRVSLSGFSRTDRDDAQDVGERSADRLGADPLFVSDDCVYRESAKSVFQWAKSWLEDNTWQRAGQAVSELALGYRITEETKQSWETWEEVGQQISTRIMAPIADDDTNMLRRTAHYYAICWAKAKEEAPPTECVDVFREHSWAATGSAAQTLIIGWLTKSTSKDTRLAAQIRAVWDSFGKTLRDPRCVRSRFDKEVDECVSMMYAAANFFEMEI